jgi:uncharacterized protein (DUF433 family)
MSEPHRITIDPALRGGGSYLRSLRICARDVLDLLAAGGSREEIFSDYLLLEKSRISWSRSNMRSGNLTIRFSNSPMRSLVDVAGRLGVLARSAWVWYRPRRTSLRFCLATG